MSDTIKQLLQNILKPLDGYKTYIAAILAAFVALNGVFHFVSSETQIIILSLAAALGLYGVRDSIKKLEKKQ